jgi:hypothetical protein
MIKDKSPQKIKIPKEIFWKGQDKPFKWSDLKHLLFEDDDEISIVFDEGFVSENNSRDASYIATVTRMVEETDGEFEKRQKEVARDEKWAKERRRESYLRLKKEFEGEA